jgi:hypothetical protein
VVLEPVTDHESSNHETSDLVLVSIEALVCLQVRVREFEAVRNIVGVALKAVLADITMEGGHQTHTGEVEIFDLVSQMLSIAGDDFSSNLSAITVVSEDLFRSGIGEGEVGEVADRDMGINHAFQLDWKIRFETGVLLVIDGG